MEIGIRLRELREAKRLSQGDVERQTGLFRCYVSRVENGHTTPSLPVLERWAKALEVELCQLFAVGHGKPKTRKLPEGMSIGTEEQNLSGLFAKLPDEDKSLLISLAREMVRRKGKSE